MQERVAALLGGRLPSGLTVSTFHALGVRLLREEAPHLGLKPRFSILDPADAQNVLAELLPAAERGIVRQLHWRISQWKNAAVEPEEAEQLGGDELAAARRRLTATTSARCAPTTRSTSTISSSCPCVCYGAMPRCASAGRTGCATSSSMNTRTPTAPSTSS